MPMDFPDMRSLVRAARIHQFREPLQGETEDQYRAALAGHVDTREPAGIEANEIRLGKGWDRWTPQEERDFLSRQALKLTLGHPAIKK